MAAHYFDGIHTNVLFDSVVIIALYLDAGSAQLGTVWTLFKLYKAKLFWNVPLGQLVWTFDYTELVSTNVCVLIVKSVSMILVTHHSCKARDQAKQYKSAFLRHKNTGMCLLGFQVVCSSAPCFSCNLYCSKSIWRCELTLCLSSTFRCHNIIKSLALL